MASKGLQALATAMEIAAYVDGPYSSYGLRLPKASKRPIGRPVGCYKCGVRNTTLRRFAYDKRICGECYRKLKEAGKIETLYYDKSDKTWKNFWYIRDKSQPLSCIELERVDKEDSF